MSLDGTYRDFISHWATGTLGRRTKEATVSVSTDGPVSTLWSYAVPIASIYDGRYAVVSAKNALERSSVTTSKHVNTANFALTHWPREAKAMITDGRVPTNEYEWQRWLVDFDARAEGRPTPGFSGDVVHFVFADRVGEMLEGNGFRRDRSFEPSSDVSPMSKKWHRSGQYTKLIVRIHQWSPDLAEFYLEGGPGAFIMGGTGRLLETAKAHEGDLRETLAEMMRLQERHEGAKSQHRDLGPRRLDGVEPIVKTCRCGRTYTQSEWEQLPSIGIQKLSPGEGLELRNCQCRSTLSMPVQFGEYDGADEMCESCDIGAHERCTGCGCGYCLPKREDAPGERWNYKELALGIQAELEHTDNKHIAMQIAKDHLREDPRYYTKLLKAGL